jgi:hypothetical protein
VNVVTDKLAALPTFIRHALPGKMGTVVVFAMCGVFGIEGAAVADLAVQAMPFASKETRRYEQQA